MFFYISPQSYECAPGGALIFHKAMQYTQPILDTWVRACESARGRGCYGPSGIGGGDGHRTTDQGRKDDTEDYDRDFRRDDDAKQYHN